MKAKAIEKYRKKNGLKKQHIFDIMVELFAEHKLEVSYQVKDE